LKKHYILHRQQKKFFNSKKTYPISFRINSLKKLKANIIKYENEIFKALKEDLGKSEAETYFSEISLLYNEINLALRNIKKWSSKKRISSSLINFLSSDYILPEPYGTILNISPWNYPFQLAISPIIGAVSAGNTVILKPSEYSKNTSELLKKIINESFDKRHVDVVLGGPEVGSDLLDLNWDYIFFTGSTKIGKIVAKKAAKYLTPVTLELGGKNPCVIDEKVNLKVAVKRIVWGKFLNCGQTCIAPDFILCHKNNKDEFTSLLINRLKYIYNSDAYNSSNYSKIISSKHVERLKDLVNNSNIIYGGKFDIKTKFFEPTIVEIENDKNKLLEEEIFGPILPILEYDNNDELYKILNFYKNPLAFYVFTNRKIFGEKLMRDFSFGGGAINDTIGQIINHRLPFGGIGDSGQGKYHGKESFNTFSHFKPYIVKSKFLDLNFKYKVNQKSLSFRIMKKIFRNISV
jgi:aldehyde dehydrogenase (NAD+)